MYAMILMLLKSQPDIGMLAVVTAVFFAQLFVGGLNLGMVGVALGGMARRRQWRLHVLSACAQPRDAVPASDGTDNSYQVDKALEAFGNGGLLGRGLGEGHVKDVLPDAHADFVFAVAGEEFGFLVCLFLLSIFAFIVMRGLLKLLRGA